MSKPDGGQRLAGLRCKGRQTKNIRFLVREKKESVLKAVGDLQLLIRTGIRLSVAGKSTGGGCIVIICRLFGGQGAFAPESNNKGWWSRLNLSKKKKH